MTHQKKIIVLFYGTSSWTVPVLEALLIDEHFSVVGVVTQPDRPVGRHAELQASPIKQAAASHGLPVYQFEKVKNDEAYEVLKTISADVAVLASFGQIIPQRVLDLYPHGIINVHPSLLPKYRGASPMIAPIKNRDKKTGVTVMKMDALMDHGPLLGQVEEMIQPDETASSLEKRLATLSAKMLPDLLLKYLKDEIKLQEQDHTQATTVKLLSREDGKLDWNLTAEQLERTVRAYDPWPGTFMELDGKRLKILKTHLGLSTMLSPGTRFVLDDQPCMACANGTALCLDQVQLEGRSETSGQEFIRGYQNFSHDESENT